MGTLDQFHFFRKYTLIHLNHFEKNKWDVQPKGFSNTIRWNAGHIYTATESLLQKADSQYEMKHSEWGTFFALRTKPADWTEEAPSAEDIIAALEQQAIRISDHFSNKLNDNVTDTLEIAGHKMNTVEAIIQFVCWHEGLHCGIMKSLHNA